MTSTPYDDVFHTMMLDCPELIPPMLNEFMGEHYIGMEEIVFSPNEFLILRPDGEQEKRFSDSSFYVAPDKSKRFHWECQSTEDNSIAIRMFEYDTQISLRYAEHTTNFLRVTFPHSAVLYLRSTKNTPDLLTVEMVTPGGAVSYNMPVMKLHKYDLNLIFEKRLYMLLPFYLFLHEKYLDEYEADAQKCDGLLDKFKEIKRRLDTLYQAQDISGQTRAIILIMSKKVVNALITRQPQVKEKVNEIMGGQIIDHELRQAKRQGIAQGIAEGIRGAITLLRKANITNEQIKQQIMAEYNLTEEQAEQYIQL